MMGNLSGEEPFEQRPKLSGGVAHAEVWGGEIQERKWQVQRP